MTEPLERDVSGKCDNCEDRVKKGEEERQEELEKHEGENPDEYPEAPGAKSRKEPPGSLGGKV
jgi:PHP family Zn ribbon phosphoesterase